jgi:hypothetical protein
VQLHASLISQAYSVIISNNNIFKTYKRNKARDLGARGERKEVTKDEN